jgi:hypothetical protein
MNSRRGGEKTVLRGQWQHRSVARHNHREQEKQSRHVTVAARVTKGARRKWRVENADNFLILFRAIVVGGDRFVIAASKAGSTALSKAGKVGRSRRR